MKYVQTFELIQLVFPMGAIFLTTLIVSFKVTKCPTPSIIAALGKAGIFFIYYGFFFDGTFTFLDDWTYLEKGKELLVNHVRLSNLHENWQEVLSLSGGDHFLYYLFNAYACILFGDGYFAPVGMNIILTVMIAFFGVKLMRREFPGLQYKLFYFYLLFHPDILSWSTIMNGKDILVLFLHVALLHGISFILNGKKTLAMIIVAPVACILFFLRFYVFPIFALTFFVLMFFVAKKNIGRNILLASFFVGVAAYRLSDQIPYIIDLLKKDFVNPFSGIPRFLLTPIPFNSQPAYAFLDLSAFFHWLIFPIMILGMISVWRKKTNFFRFFVFYFLGFVCFYGTYGELQGPRHRVQLDFAIALFQFCGLALLTRSYSYFHAVRRLVDLRFDSLGIQKPNDSHYQSV